MEYTILAARGVLFTTAGTDSLISVWEQQHWWTDSSNSQTTNSAARLPFR